MIFASVIWIGCAAFVGYYDVTFASRYDEGTSEAIRLAVTRTLLPPVAAGAFGLGLAWVLGGFRRDGSTATPQDGSKET